MIEELDVLIKRWIYHRSCELIQAIHVRFSEEFMGGYFLTPVSSSVSTSLPLTTFLAPLELR